MSDGVGAKPDFGVLNRNCITIVSENMVLSGSDNLRNALGAGFVLNYGSSEPMTNRYIDKNKVQDLRDLEVFRYNDLKNPYFNSIETNVYTMAPIDPDLAIPNWKIPFRIYANNFDELGDSEKAVFGDLHWRQIFEGGVWAATQYTPLMQTDRYFYDISFDLKLPVPYQTTRKIIKNNVGDIDELKRLANLTEFNIKANYYDYNHMVQNYQDWANSVDSELLLPNYNIITPYYYESTDGFNQGPPASDDTDAMNNWGKKEQLRFNPIRAGVMNYHFPEGAYYTQMEKDHYFGQYFIETDKKDQYSNFATTYQKNIMFDHHYFEFLQADAAASDSHTKGILAKNVTGYEDLFEVNDKPIQEVLSTFYNITLEFDRHIDSGNLIKWDRNTENFPAFGKYKWNMANASFNTLDVNPITLSIEQEKFSSSLLVMLKELDQGRIPEMSYKNLETRMGRTYHTGDIGDNEIFIENDKDPAIFKYCNFLELLIKKYNDYKRRPINDYIFGGPPRVEHNIVSGNDTISMINEVKKLGLVIDGILDQLGSYFIDKKAYEDNSFMFAHGNQSIFEHFINPKKKFKEVLAYKIEKFASEATGDSSQMTPVQTFWVYNSTSAAKKIQIRDTQVKMGVDYTYKTTAYVLVTGHKYRYANFRLTKQIGTGKILPDSPSNVQHCLLFYNPATDQAARQTLTTSENITGVTKPQQKSALSTLNEHANSTLDLSEFSQAADFNFFIEPCVELIKVPMFQKTVRVMDNPPNSINVIPFHFIDTTNRVGFKIGSESFIKRPYPEVITSEDVIKKSKYFDAVERIPTELVNQISQSPARFIEMYRTNSRPTSFRDFENALVATIDLRIKDDVYNYADYMAADQISPNRKYYYLFRFLNENKMPGPVSQIIECELKNDGGYVYSLFDSVDTSTFTPDTATSKTKSFKKLLQLEPHIRHMTFDETACDFSQNAASQINNLIVGNVPNNNRLWDKKFKIRLTSKKTGKKVDLNTSFVIRQRDLSKSVVFENSSNYEPITEPYHSSLFNPPAAVIEDLEGVSVPLIDTSEPVVGGWVPSGLEPGDYGSPYEAVDDIFGGGDPFGADGFYPPPAIPPKGGEAPKDATPEYSGPFDTVMSPHGHFDFKSLVLRRSGEKWDINMAGAYMPMSWVETFFADKGYEKERVVRYSGRSAIRGIMNDPTYFCLMGVNLTPKGMGGYTSRGGTFYARGSAGHAADAIIAYIGENARKNLTYATPNLAWLLACTLWTMYVSEYAASRGHHPVPDSTKNTHIPGGNMFGLLSQKFAQSIVTTHSEHFFDGKLLAPKPQAPSAPKDLDENKMLEMLGMSWPTIKLSFPIWEKVVDEFGFGPKDEEGRSEKDKEETDEASAKAAEAAKAAAVEEARKREEAIVAEAEEKRRKEEEARKREEAIVAEAEEVRRKEEEAARRKEEEYLKKKYGK